MEYLFDLRDIGLSLATARLRYASLEKPTLQNYFDPRISSIEVTPPLISKV
jgi:hypothetical protein